MISQRCVDNDSDKNYYCLSSFINNLLLIKIKTKMEKIIFEKMFFFNMILG